MLEQIGAFLEDNWLPSTLAAQTISVLARRQAEAAVAKKRAEYMAQERARQAQYSQQASRAFDSSLQATAPPALQAGQQQAVATRQAAAERPAPEAGSIESGEYAGVSKNAPEVVKQAAARAIIGALNKGKEYTASQAQLKSFGDAQLGANITMGRNANNINTAGMLSRSSAGVLPTQLAAANQSGQGWRVAHDMFGGASDLGMMFGMGMMNNARKRATPQVSQGRGSVPVYGALPQE